MFIEHSVVYYDYRIPSFTFSIYFGIHNYYKLRGLPVASYQTLPLEEPGYEARATNYHWHYDHKYAHEPYRT
jgi:hypothetical protein